MALWPALDHGRNARGKKRPLRAAVAVLVSILVEVGATWHRGARLGGHVIVRCRRNHLFTTIWIPGVSLKSLRLGPWRFQRCPVGRHWSLVTPVNAAGLTQDQRRRA